MADILFGAFDESNNGREPLVVAGYFSTHLGIAFPKERYIPTRRKSRVLRLSDESVSRILTGKNYRFIIDKGDILGDNGGALARAAPILVRDYLSTRDRGYENLVIYLDGEVCRKHRDEITERLKNSISSEVICFSKKKDYENIIYPDALLYADGIAHSLYIMHSKGILSGRSDILKNEVKLNGRIIG